MIISPDKIIVSSIVVKTDHPIRESDPIDKVQIKALDQRGGGGKRDKSGGVSLLPGEFLLIVLSINITFIFLTTSNQFLLFKSLGSND